MKHVISADFLYDKGYGFEKGRVIKACVRENDKTWYMELDTKLGFEAKLFCWKPFECPVALEIKELVGAQIVGHNAHTVENNIYTFIVGDAFFYFKPEKNVQQITIVCAARELEVCDQRELLRKDEQVYKTLQQELIESKNKIEQLTRDLESVTSSTIWRKTEPLRRWKDRNNAVSQTEEQNKGIVRQYDDNTSIEELLYSSIDVIKIKERILTIEGWVICVEHEIHEAELLLEDSYGICHAYNIELKGRRDVADTLGVRFTGDCGINFCADYDSYSEQQIKLNLKIDGQWHLIDTQKTIPPCKETKGGEFFWEQYFDGEPPLDYWRFCKNNLEEEADCLEKSSDWKADIIVPVYNGIEYLPKLFKGIERTELSYRLIVVNDCSPDKKVNSYLEEYASCHSNVILLQNQSNQGFVKSVNRALKETKNHTVLVNTDVELPEKWLERMLQPIYMGDKVASVTPFSNSATIYSFPCFGEDNKLFMGLSVDEIDRVFAKVKQRNVSTPTGVGFCMAMNKDTIEQIGILDEDTFEKGYGEENDWCQRAIKAGYQNVYAENLFVYHNHGGSFDSETKLRLLKENGAKLLEKHPEYQLDVEAFCRRDPNRDIRIFAKFELMFRSNIPMVLAFDHDLGGGAASYLDEKLRVELQQGKLVSVVRYNDIADRYRIKVSFGEYSAQIVARNRREIMDILKKRDYEQIWINELASYLELEQWLKDIVELRKQRAEWLRMLLHDYFSVCPSLNLVDPTCRYCGLPDDVDTCMKCLTENTYVYNHEYKDVTKWRDDWGRVLNACDEVVVFSQDSKKRIKDVYPGLENIKLIPHHVEPLQVVKKEKVSKTVNVGILGAISEQKGLRLVKEMIAYLEKQNMEMRLVIIGEAAEKLSSPVLTVTGRYERNEIPALTVENDVDVFFIPSVWPETFSYTTAEVMSMDMPLAVFDIGAPAERVKCYNKGLVIGDIGMDVGTLLKKICEFVK